MSWHRLGSQAVRTPSASSSQSWRIDEQRLVRRIQAIHRKANTRRQKKQAEKEKKDKEKQKREEEKKIFVPDAMHRQLLK